MPPHPQTKSGSVLLLTLMLMGLMLLVVVSFSAYVRMETRNVSTRMELQRARANARLGMELALARLQRAAGPDTRVTAPAALLNDTVAPSNRHVTGVWTTGSDDPPEWMVSYPLNEGTFDIATSYPESDTIELLGEADLGPDAPAGAHVRAHRVHIPDGSYAYWVADEGVKTSLGKINRLPEAGGDRLTPVEKKRLAQTTPGRMRGEWHFPELRESAAAGTNVWSEIEPHVSKTTERAQLDLVQGLRVDELEKRYHEVTWNAFGVLADPGAGGLKHDLSYAGGGPYTDELQNHPALRSWVDHRIDGDNDSITLGGVENVDPPVGAPAFTRSLLFTEFALYVGVFRQETASDDLRVQLALRADVWNPYSFPIRFNPEGKPDLHIEIVGLPSHRVEWVTAEGTSEERSGNFTLSLDEVDLTLQFTKNGPETSGAVTSFPLDLHTTIAPGEVKKISQRAEGPLEDSLAGDATYTVQDDVVRTRAEASEVTIRIRTPEGALLQEFRDLPFEAFHTEAVARHNLVSRSKPGYAEYQFIYHFKFYDELANGSKQRLSDMEKWSAHTDPRQPVLDFKSHPELEDLIYISQPAEATADNTLFGGKPEFFSDSYGSYVRFFDLPSTPPVSVGSLQHLSFSEREPFAVGSPNGGSLNQLLDAYYFSSVPQTGGHGLLSDALPNIHLVPVDGKARKASTAHLRHSLSASNFLVKGAFNIHSTNMRSWMALLGGIHLYDWSFRVNEPTPDPQKREHVRNGVFRHAFGADRHYTHPSTVYPDYPEISQEEKRDWYRDYWRDNQVLNWKPAYTVGMRELRNGNNPDGINDLEELAAAIVDELETRGEPFDSLKELADSGLVQDAIDRTRINTVVDEPFVDVEGDFNKHIPRNAPSFLTQADIFQLIAPVAQVRSDTFVIRATGEHTDASGRVLATAWCEAEVQRMPEPLEFRDLSNPAAVTEDYETPPTPMGRRFKIVSFRWLPPRTTP